MYRVSFVLLIALSFAGCDRAEPSPQDRLALAAQYLWNQQAEDGGWHSGVHGILRGGQAWTPFVLNALLQVPEDIYSPPEGGIERGLEFIRDRVNDDGALGLADPVVLEYPNYATAYALMVLAEHGAERDTALIRRMSSYLASQQF
ncbi:MAG: prenyltransferase/squalene oxidase repeat-containing protein, partial [Rubricoccaceae bacterium]|nr:prenyltransferase/squalene oxidase repeat-containing protein [Rubricoccaceae bacterium]